MAKVLPCHHFRGQRIRRCEEAVAVAAAGRSVIVALDHQINVYGDRNALDTDLVTSPNGTIDTHDIGSPFVYHTKATFNNHTPSPPSSTKGSSPASREGGPAFDNDGDLCLLHSFATIDVIAMMSFNEKGGYLLCLEKREGSTETTSIRTYFHWEKNHESNPMRARIAGLVSPTGSEPEDDSLTMVEIPLTSPATTATSCNLTGHIACLSAESVVTIFLFREKEVAGRVKVHYYDFDRTYAIELSGFVPDRLHFLANYISCSNSSKLYVIRISKKEHEATTFDKRSGSTEVENDTQKLTTPESHMGRVVFDPKDESVVIHIPMILRANRKRKFPTNMIVEEFREEITTNMTRIIFQAKQSPAVVEDVLRVGIASLISTSKLVDIGLYPIRMNDELGGVAFFVGTTKEGYLYHLPSKKDLSLIRVANYPFNANLVALAFDSLVFHALTETGLESYTVRSLYYAVKDVEGIKPFVSECPLQDDPPSLIGIRPFVNVQKMASNNSVLCMLANSNATSKVAGHSTEEPSWTIYSLELPDVETIYDDIVRIANAQKEAERDTRMTLLKEAFVVVKLFMNSFQIGKTRMVQKYKEICKLLGLEYLKMAVVSKSTSAISSDDDASEDTTSNAPSGSVSSVSEFSSQQSIIPDSSALIDQGVTYLLMGGYTAQEIFSPENWAWMRDPNFIKGIVRLIEVTFLNTMAHVENQRISPTLAPVLTEFLSTNGPIVLVDLIIQSPFIRECNSKRLLTVLQHLAESKEYPAKESLAVIMTYITIGGVDLNTRNNVNAVLQKTNSQEVGSLLKKDLILETRLKQTFLTDLAICIMASEVPNIVTDKLKMYLNDNKISVSLIMFAFAQALNVNTDIALQQCISKCLAVMVESYVSRNLNKLTPSTVSEEDKRAIHLLVRTYLSNINFTTENSTSPAHSNDATANKREPPTPPKSPSATSGADASVIQRNQVFGNVCNCVNFLLSVNCIDGYLTPQSQNLATITLFVNEEGRENFIKLMSLLSNLNLSNIDGVKDIILTYLYKSATQTRPAVNSPLYFVLQIFSETPEKAINILLSKQPTTLMLFAKETFGKVPVKWKILIASLKKKIQEAGTDVNATEIFSTILESVFLHLANTLTPLELEQVLDKESEENNKIHGICKRVELANNYANMVISVASQYLSRK